MTNKTSLFVKLVALILVFVTMCGVALGIAVNMGRNGNIMYEIFEGRGDDENEGEVRLSGSNEFTNINHIDVSAISYDVSVETHDKDTVVVEEHIRGYGRHKENEIYAQGDTLYFKEPKTIAFFRLGGGRIVIKVPKKSEYNYQLKSVSGDVILDAKSKEADLETVSGNVKVYKAGRELQGQSVSGTVKVHEPFEDIKAKSVSGSVRLTADKNTKEIDANTTSGSVRIALRGEIGYEMEYSSVSSTTKDEYHGIKYGKNGTARYGDKALKIDASSISGSIRLEDWD
ncbi:MAG: DUF4097 family beta strand repeat-containing protein [Oscillospiraceae bacterium]